jgi:hypothetical protein
MAEASPAKRRRTESTELTDPPDDLEHSSEVWFEDGNVIIQAETTLFRVHRGLLSAQSQVLRELLTSLRDSKLLTTVSDGCPVLWLSDSATDMMHFLKAMMDRRYVFLPLS